MVATRSPIVVGLGELLWDDFPSGKRPGGAPANVAFQANQLGCRGVVVSRVGQDAAGDEILEFLRRKKLSTQAVQRDSEHPTGRVTVTLDQHGHPSYVIHKDVAWDFLAMDDPACPLLKFAQKSDAVCFGTLAQRRPMARQAVRQFVAATRSDCFRVFDVNLRQKFFNKSIIVASLQLAKAVKLNDDEVPVVATLLGLPTGPKRFAKRLLAEFELQLVCITRGSRGCLIVTADARHEEPGIKIQVADTVGAGDAFTAGLIVASLNRWPVDKTARFANQIGALVASRQGAMPELRTEFSQLLART